MANKNVTKIDRHNYPAIFTACLMVLQDNGAINRVEMPMGGAGITILLPIEDFIPSLAKIEAELRELSGDAEWEEFLIGEESEALRIAVRNPHLAHFWCILNVWFDDGMPIQQEIDLNKGV